MNQRLVRTNQSDKVFAGVCGGLARRFDMSPALMRFLFVASLLLPGPQLVIYLVLWALIPAEDGI
ncbi:PspC domain-containing protein [Mobilicoccus sp.]|uniref:PspC domain-containing protein n=1 Tax=Mobilicoccus sp. TaxID=2034349 RepID=UPI002897E58E|nr:PspC domain-containing protein [Mobilicoccus sp.]